VSQATAIYEIRNMCFNARIPSTRGTLRGRHDSSVRDAMDAKARQTMRAGADGQVAWSWSPDAGIKSIEMRVSRKAGAGSMGDGG